VEKKNMNTTTTTDRATIVGVFEDRAHAQQAINDLKQAGFRDDQIGVTSRDGERAGDGNADDGDNYAAEGGMTGLATGAGIGALWGLAVVSNVLPGIGPAIVGGTLAAILSSAAAGAAAAGLAGMLIGLGIPRDEAEFYEGEFRAGRTLVTVKTDGRGAEAQSILSRHGGYDIETRGTRTGMEGKSPMAASSSHSALQGSSASTFKSSEACPPASRGAGKASTTTAAGQGTTAAGQGTIQASEEVLRVHKHKDQAGEVKVRKEVHTEHKTLEVPIEREEVVIERHPVTGHQPASTQFKEGQTIRVPVSEEHVEVEKTPVVKEEVSVGKRKVQDTKHVDATVRKEEIKVENQGGAKFKDRR
jgi:uncharacterized protein (TIGR02271 family)